MSPQWPVVVRDPRFVAGRATVGQRTAVDVFATLLQEAVRTYGDAAASSRRIETAPAYYEYGNALLRYALRQQAEAAAAEEEAIDPGVARSGGGGRRTTSPFEGFWGGQHFQ
jgi:hypothetical protein